MAGLGTLILVVGPSGVGKDTLIDGAKETLMPSNRFFFPQRIITRPADAGGELHKAVSESDFSALEQSDAFLLSWRAHGLCYGIARDTAETARANGQAVVINVSRSVLDCARNRTQPMSVVAVTASPEAIRKRLEARGREDASEIEARLARAAAYSVTGGDVTTVWNDGSREDGICSMVQALEAASSYERQPAE